ncbi:MAG: NUDIX hydrolase, partial [Chloroflexi bacterium]|nr:NUDIX hydrolase [Chloroflexota bacterium]
MRVKKERALAEGKHLRLYELELVTESGQTKHYELVRRHHAVMICALTANREVLLVEQFRVPAMAPTVELPAGLCDVEGEDREETALRELEEETGYRAESARLLHHGYSTAGMSDEYVYLYLAENATHVGEPEDEIELHVVPLDQAMDFLRQQQQQGKALDYKTLPSLALIER